MKKLFYFLKLLTLAFMLLGGLLAPLDAFANGLENPLDGTFLIEDLLEVDELAFDLISSDDIAIHVQSAAMAPRCISGGPANTLTWRANRPTAVRVGPNSGSQVDTLPAGRIVTGPIGPAINGWRRINFNGRLGWVNGSHLTPIFTC